MEEQIEFVLEEKDIHTVKACLNYCYHRLLKHEDTGISHLVKLSEIDRLRKEIS